MASFFRLHCNAYHRCVARGTSWDYPSISSSTRIGRLCLCPKDLHHLNFPFLLKRVLIHASYVQTFFYTKHFSGNHISFAFSTLVGHAQSKLLADYTQLAISSKVEHETKGKKHILNSFCN